MKQLRPLTVYGFTIFSNAAISFFTFSLLTHYLTEVDYGIINLYNSFILLLMPFIGIGVPFVLNVDYFKMTSEAFKEQFSNAIIIPFISCVVFTLILFFFHQYVQQATKVNFFFTMAAAFACLMFVYNDIIQSLFRNKEKYLLFAGFSFTKNILEACLSLLFVVGLHYSWSGRLNSSLISLVFVGTVFFVFARKWKLFTQAFNQKAIGAILLSGLPFIPERLAIFTLGYSDRFFIDYYSGTADVGYYGAGAQVALIVNLSILTLNNTFYPVLFKELSREVLDYSNVKRITWTFIAISAVITACVILCVPILFKLFIGPNFQPGKIYAVNLAIGLFFWAIYNVFVAFLLYTKKNKVVMKVSIFGMIVSILSNFINIRQFGALGATYTSIIVYFLMAVVTIYLVSKHYNLKAIFR